ncbi:MAG: addiction module antidote protein, HigA family [Actinobacteria bacterium HGW-Actinobacteria-7]|jgi:addiction module HigA family antidote|nr:MAG: addiction module antidote protein, HigA family [Actinobacteria bacterium HGW-Actinobacteria-7]
MRGYRFEPPHLGTVLQLEYLEDYQLTAQDFAVAIQVPRERVERVLAGSEPIDADLSLRLARLFGGSADGWLRWQQGHDLWSAHERIQAQLETIRPLDPATRRSATEAEPLDSETIAELRCQMADLDDPRRWVVVSAIDGEEVQLYEESLSRMFYDVESGCYCTELAGATPFKRQSAAEAVATALGDRERVVEVTKQDLEKPHRDEAADRELQERFFRHTGQGMTEWDVGVYLRRTADMVAYLEAAAGEGDGELIAAAVADVMRAMRTQTTVAYLEARGALGSRAAYERALGKVTDAQPDDGDDY